MHHLIRIYDLFRRRAVSGNFCCFYCGKTRPNSARSKEHIIPACLGATLRNTGTLNVCQDCNTRAGEEVDLPFCRDRFIESKRFFHGITSRRRRPVFMVGRIEWNRPERVELYYLEHKIIAYRFRTHAKESCVMFGSIGQATAPETEEVIRKSLKERFAGHRRTSLNRAESDEERSLILAIQTLGQESKIRASIDITAWDRAIVKMGLGLACLVLGEEYTKSPQADMLRSFLWEQDPDKRSESHLNGSAGILAQDKHKTSHLILPSPNLHAFCLTDIGSKIAFTTSLFGEYENILEIDATGAFCDRLPGTLMRGVGWIVDPQKKETTGPVPFEDLVRQRGEARRLAAEEEFALKHQVP